MNSKFVENLNITNIDFDEKRKHVLFETEVLKDIYTTQNRMVFKHVEGQNVPDYVLHGTWGHECFCGCFGETYKFKKCELLTEHVDTIYQRIKDHPKAKLVENEKTGLLMEIHDVESTRKTSTEQLEIKGTRTDCIHEFTIKLIKYDDIGWHMYYHYCRDLKNVPNDLLLDYRNKWNQLLLEVKEHPKVRLHMLF